MRIAGGLIWKQRLETGTGFADAKLSEILPCGRVAPFVQDDKKGTRLHARLSEILPCGRVAPFAQDAFQLPDFVDRAL
jgi:hypothetical protein